MPTFPRGWRARDRGFDRPPVERGLRRISASPSPRRRSPRFIVPNRDQKRPTRNVAVKVIRPGVRKRFQPRPRRPSIWWPALQERFCLRARRLRLWRSRKRSRRQRRSRWICGWRPPPLSEFGGEHAQDPGFRVPDGRLGADGPRRPDHGVDRRHQDVRRRGDPGCRLRPEQLADTLIQSFLRHALRDGFFHADMHQGNLFIDRDGTIVAVDLGIVGRLGKKERRYPGGNPLRVHHARLYRASPRSISRPAMFRATTIPRASRRRSAPSASRSTGSRRRRSPWRNCSRCSSR